MATQTYNYNDPLIFNAGASIAFNDPSSPIINKGFIEAFDIFGCTQLEMNMSGPCAFELNGGSPTTFNTPILSSTFAQMGVLTSALDAATHYTVKVYPTLAANALVWNNGTQPLVRLTGPTAPVATMSTLYPYATDYQLVSGGIVIGRQVRDLTHIAVDGGLRPNPGGQGVQYVGAPQYGSGGSIRFRTLPVVGATRHEIHLFASQGVWGPGGMTIFKDGVKTNYVQASSTYYTGSVTPDTLYHVIDVDALPHVYEIKFSLNCLLASMTLLGLTIDSSYTPPSRPVLFGYGDSKTFGFIGGAARSGGDPAPADSSYDSVPGDELWAGHLASVDLGMASLGFGIPAQSLSNMKTIVAQIGTGFGSQSYFANVDVFVGELGVNNIGDPTEQTNFQTNLQTWFDGIAALCTKSTCKILISNNTHCTGDRVSDPGFANFQQRRTWIASNVATRAITDARFQLLDVHNVPVNLGSPDATPWGTVDGVHLNAQGTQEYKTKLESTLATTATSYTLSESATTGPVGTTVSLAFYANGLGTQTITPSVSGVSGTFTPTTIALNNLSPVNVSFVPTTSGTAVFGSTNSGSLTDPPTLNYIVTALPNLHKSLSLLGVG